MAPEGVGHPSLRILFVSRAFPPDVGDIPTHNHGLATALSQLADVHVVANRRGRAALPFFLPWATLRALLGRHDVVLLGDATLALTGWLVKLVRPRTTVVCAIRGADVTWRPGWYQALWVRRFLPSLDLLVAPSRQARDAAEARGVPEARIVVVPDGVHLSPPAPRPAGDRLGPLLDRPLGDTRVLLSVGRLLERKGVGWFVDWVMPKLAENVLYLVAGEGPDRSPIEQLIALNGLQDRVLLLGAVDDETRDLLYATCDVFVQPAIEEAGGFEGFGVAALEAASFGAPVVAARLEGLRDAIADGVSGVLVTSQSMRGFTDEITRLLDDDEARGALGASAEAHVRAHHGWPAAALHYLEAISDHGSGKGLSPRQPGPAPAQRA